MFYNPNAFALAVVAFVLSIFAFSRVNKTTRKLDELQREVDRLRQRIGGETETEAAAETTETVEPAPDKATTPAPTPEPAPEAGDFKPIAATSEAEPAKTFEQVTEAAEEAPETPLPADEQGGWVPPPPPPPSGPTLVDRMMDSFINNWVIWLSALSLACGGIFIVQYGIERGYIGPVARVVAALVFGAALIAGAEFIRRKDPEGSEGVLTVPVALATGGIASLFAGVVAAHVLYDLTNALVGFASMALVSWLALVGGLLYGPVLAVIGLLGAFISPALVASEGPSPLMYLYFLMVLLASLTVERWRRWIWLSSLAVAGALIWGLLLHWAMPKEPFLAAYSVGVIAIAVTVPAFGILPKSNDSGWLTFSSLSRISYVYPTVLAVGTAVAATIILTYTSQDTLIDWQLALIALVALLALSVLLLQAAQNLDQLAAVFSLGLIATVTLVDMLPDSPRLMLFGVDYDQTVRAYFPFTALSVLAMTLLLLIGSLWRSAHSIRPLYWNILTALLPWLALVVLWAKWSDTDVLTEGNWQFLFAVLAVLHAGLAALLLRRGKDATPSADILSCGGFLGLGVLAGLILSPEQQIVGFAVLATAAFGIEKRFSFRMLGWISLLYTSLAFGRIVLDPGLANAIRYGFIEGPVFIAVAAALFFGAARWAAKVKSPAHLVQFETASVAGLGVLLSVLIGRTLDAIGHVPDNAYIGLHVSVWLALGFVQFKRAEMIESYRLLRKIFGWAYLSLSCLALLVGFVLLDPVFGAFAESVAGFFPIDSIIISYGLPALVLFLSYRIPALPTPLPRLLGLPVVGAMAIWVLILEIRRFWHGDYLDAYRGILTPELYSYTVALLIATVTCVLAALIRKDPLLRKWGLGLVALTAVKVFLWDMSDLQGLSRATAFIALGLTLAGIAWLFQKYTMQKPAEPPEEPKTEA